jgi:2-polyprenyl-6-methoxyphenol hydroxylase-like FAD-dependent oxidoreductase
MEAADIVVVGGGFAGLAAAAALAGGGRKIVVLEARASSGVRFRGELLQAAGASLLSRLGAREGFERAGAASIDGFCAFPGGEAPPVMLPYPVFPGPGIAMRHEAMLAALSARVTAAPGVELRVGCTATALLREGAQVAGVATSDGDRIGAPLTVVADGRSSPLRASAGIHAETSQVSWTAALEASDMDLPRPGYGHVLVGAPLPVLLYPLGGRSIRACFDLPLSFEGGRSAVRDALRETYLPRLPLAVRAPLEESLSRAPISVCANHRVRVARPFVPGLVCVGDAAGCSHPLTAAGLTLALRDAISLAEALAEGPPLQALARHHRRTVPFRRTSELLADALHDVLAAEDEGHRLLREAVFDHWQGEVRRERTMALLSGADSRTSVLASEYARVVARAFQRSSWRAGPVLSVAQIAIAQAVRLGRYWAPGRPAAAAQPGRAS